MTTTLDEQETARIRSKYERYIDNWLNIKDSDRKEILSYLKNITEKDIQSAQGNQGIRQDTKIEEVVDLKKFKKINLMNLSVASNLYNILSAEERKNPVSQYQDNFSHIQFAVGQEMAFPPSVEKNEQSMNPKQELLKGLELALKAEQQKNNKNQSLIAKGKIMKQELMFGKKAKKILSTFTTIDAKEKRVNTMVSKTAYKHQASLTIANTQHKVELLQDIHKYLLQDKSETFDVNKFNDAISMLYRYHRNELQLLNHPELVKKATEAHEQALLAPPPQAALAVNNAEAEKQEEIGKEVAPAKSKEIKKEIPTKEKLIELYIKLEEIKQAQKVLPGFRNTLLSSKEPLNKETFSSKMKNAVLSTDEWNR